MNKLFQVKQYKNNLLRLLISLISIFTLFIRQNIKLVQET